MTKKLKINLLYFSCGRDEELLAISIASAKKQYDFNRIIVAEDMRDPMKNKLEGVEYVPKLASTEKLYGLDNIEQMHKIFREQSYDCDFLQKCDSDMVFINSNAYHFLEKNAGLDAYGSFPMANERIIPDKHFAGSTYFLSMRVCQNLEQIHWPDDVKYWDVMNYPEDMVTSHVISKISGKVVVDKTAQNGGGFFLFDTFLTKIAAKDVDIIRKYSYAHCRTSKSVMEYLFEKLYK